MALKSPMPRLPLLVFCFSLAAGGELRQDKAEKPFTLKCSDGEYVSMFSGNFTGYGSDRRRYRIQCQKLRVSGQVKCSSGKETELMKYFEDVGCGKDEYVGGIESTKFKDGDRKFRLICCQTIGMTVSESSCRGVETKTQNNFTEKLMEDEVIHKLSSKFSLWQDRGLVVDRRWLLNICKVSNASEPDSSNDKGNETSAADTDKPTAISLSESCKTSADGFSQNEPSEGPETNPPGKNTPAFKSFKVYCPNGHAIKSIRVVAKMDFNTGRQDTAFDIRCEKLPLDDDITSCPVKRKEMAFRDDNEVRQISSLQSPCDPSTGQFLCGLSGIYHTSRRRLSATCCTIKDVFPSTQLEPMLADPTDEGFAEIKSSTRRQYLVNLDQLPGGLYVGHMAKFSIVYEQKGKTESTPNGCRCKCPCQCQKEEPSQHHHHGHQKASSAETLRSRRSKTNCGGEDCSCKCMLPCDK